MADTRESLFGPSPQDIAAAQAAQQQQDAFNWAKLPAGRGMVAAGAQAGQAFGRLGGSLLGGQDPAQAKAAMLQQAQRDTEMRAQAMGINLATSPQDYYKVAAMTLQKYGLVDEAQNVMSIAQGHDLAERQMKVNEQVAGAKGTRRAYAGKDGTIYDGITGEVIQKGSSSTKPTSTQGKIYSDYENGIYGEPGSPEAMAARDAAIQKANHIAPPSENNVTVYSDKQSVDLQNDLVKAEVTPILSQGRAATSTRQFSSSIRTQLRSGNVQPGFAADFRQSLATAAQFFGVDEETLTNLKSNPDAMAATRSASSAIIGSLAAGLSSNNKVSAREIELYKNAAPNMMMTAPGMDFVNEVADLKASWEERRAEAATNAVINSDPKKPAEAINAIREWERANPFVVTPELVDKLKRSYQIASKMNDKSTKSLAEAVKSNAAIVGNNYIYNGTLVTYLGKNPKTNGVKYEVVK